MKLKAYLGVLIGILLSPFTAFADIYFQNYTDASLTVEYQYCTPYPYLRCSDPITSPSITQQTAYDVPPKAPYTYVVAMQATSDDGWNYTDPQSGENCGLIRFYTTNVPEFANFSKTLVKSQLQCQTSDGLAKISK